MINFEELEQLVIKWGEVRGLYDPMNGSDPIAQISKLYEEFTELDDALHGVDQEKVIDGIGDMMVVLTVIAKMAGTTMTHCYGHAYLEIKDRKGKMVNGIFVKEL